MSSPASQPRRFVRRFLDALPGDPSDSLTPRQVSGALWSPVKPTPVAAPQLLAWSQPLASELGLDDATRDDPQTAAVLGGNALWDGMAPYAANYGGHQFGHWAGQLGDGRAITLGELVGPDGRVHELQLKGAGPTPYSRRGDGRAVLRSSIREFLCSEAMAALGVPTTRALSLVGTGEPVVRDMFYDGNARPEPGAIVCRVAPSFLRFGNFELPSSRGDVALLRRLTDHTITTFFPQLGAPGPAAYEGFLREVAVRTGRLIAHWMANGFVHGVMNTDNMSILGLTIDYGPYGWIEPLDHGFTPNTTDFRERRYAFGNQPSVGMWNVARLGEALLPLFDGREGPVEEAVTDYQEAFGEAAIALYCARLGLTFDAHGEDATLIHELRSCLGEAEVDVILFLRRLSRVARTAAAPTELPAELLACWYQQPQPDHVARALAWLRKWHARVRAEARGGDAAAAAMDRANPKYVLRNWLAQDAIDAAEQGDLSKVHRLLDVLRRPFDEQPEHEALAQKRPEWARHKPGCATLSCSS
jgi:uncharacterized protein YdiU (UPF0061 family)